MAFLGLPDELLGNIVEYVDQEDLLAIVLTCWRLYNVAHARYEEHLYLQRQYSTIDVPDSSGVIILLHFLRNLRFARYPRNLDGRGILLTSPSANFQLDEDEMYDGNLEELQEAVRLLRGLKITEKFETAALDDLLDRIGRGEDEAAFAMLMAVLPNLTHLDLPLFAVHSLAFRAVLFLTLSAPCFVGSPPPSFPLSGLLSVSFAPRLQALARPGYYREFPIWNPFVSVPSLRKLSLAEVDFVNHGVNWENNCSNIEHIVLRNCKINSQPFLQFLSSMKNLKIFDCSLEMLEVYRGFPQTICNPLAEWKSSTLETFRMNMIYHPLFMSSVEFLKGFSALRYIEIGWPWIAEHGIQNFFKKVLPPAIDTVRILPSGAKMHLLCGGGQYFLVGADKVDERDFPNLKEFRLPLWSWHKEKGLSLASWAADIRFGFGKGCVCGICDWQESYGGLAHLKRQKSMFP